MDKKMTSLSLSALTVSIMYLSMTDMAIGHGIPVSILSHKTVISYQDILHRSKPTKITDFLAFEPHVHHNEDTNTGHNHDDADFEAIVSPAAYMSTSVQGTYDV